MMKRILSTLFFVFLTLFFFSSPAQAQTGEWSTINSKCVGGYGDGPKDVATIQGLECLVANVLASVITIVGIAAFIMFLIGSFRYLTAGANSKGVESARNSITYAIAGIVVALASFIILRFISQFTGISTFLQFSTQITTQ